MAAPAQWAPSSMPARAPTEPLPRLSRRLAASSCRARAANIRETSLPLAVTKLSTACETASTAAAAATSRGADAVSSGSSRAARKRALRSPQAIFMPLSPSPIRANRCASLPVPAVVGTPMAGSSGFFALPSPR